jgi:hypothetical protein
MWSDERAGKTNSGLFGSARIAGDAGQHSALDDLDLTIVRGGRAAAGAGLDTFIGG